MANQRKVARTLGDFGRRVLRRLTAIAAALFVATAATGCATSMTQVGNPHTDPVGGALVIVAVVPATAVRLVAMGPCELADDPGQCACRAASVVFVPFLFAAKLVGTVVSPGTWWTALSGGDWVGEDPWGLRGAECRPSADPALAPLDAAEPRPPEPPRSDARSSGDAP